MERYEAYKNSGVGWVGEIPTSWDEMPVKRVCDVVLGKMLCSEDKGGYHQKPYLRAKNVMWLKVDQDDIKKMWFSSNELSQYRLKAGDLLVSEGGEVGRTCIWNNEIHECYIQNSVQRVRFGTDKESRYYLYLFYCLGKIGVFDAIVNRISIAHLTKEKLQQVPILNPTYSQQTAIANFLDRKTTEIDALIAQKERLLELYEEEKTAIINHAVTKGLDPNAELKDSGVDRPGKIPVGWEVKKLKYLLNFHDNQRIPLSADQRAHMTNKKYDYYGASGVIDQVEGYIFDGDYILLGEDGANLLTRSTALAFKASGKFWVNNHAHILSAKDGQLDFFVHFLESTDYTIFVSGSAQPKLTAEALGTVDLLEPPKDQQTTIVQHIEAETARINAKIVKTQRIIELQKEYRTALISEAVTGKIKVPELPTQEASA